jgi:8-oxo-dGTP pyrophosphatase MutT (NUDIX family)
LIDALHALARPFDRDADPVHVTASAIVVGPRGVLLHRHKTIGLWLQPGGHIEPGEDPSAAALREAEEETGLRGLSHPRAGPWLFHVDVHPVPSGHIHLDLRYLLEATADEAPRPPEGEGPARWFEWDDATAIADAGLAGALRAARSASRRERP